LKSFAFRSTFRRSATPGDAFVAKRRKNFNFVEVRLHLNNKNKKNAFFFVLRSTFRNFNFVEVRLHLNNKNKKYAFFFAFRSLIRNFVA